MKLKLIVVLVGSLISACASTNSTVTKSVQNRPTFEYVIDGGDKWGVVQAFTSMGKAHVQFLDIDRANPIFLGKDGTEIAHERMGMYAILPSAPADFYIASSFGRAHVLSKSAGIPVISVGDKAQSLVNPNEKLALDKASVKEIQAKIESLTAEKIALEKTISEREAAAKLAQQQLDELLLVTKLLNDPSGNTFLGEGGTVVNRVYFDDLSTNVVPSILDSSIVLEASRAADKVVVRGFTDSSRPTPMARDLASLRAAKTKKFLVSQGIPDDKIRAYYRSYNHFLVPNSGDLRRFNRRVEITYHFSGLEG